MCVDLVNASFKVGSLSSSEKSVLNVLAFRADKYTHLCWLSAASLCESTSLNEKTVYKCLSSLCVKGLITKTGKLKGKTKSTPVYKLSLPKIGCAKKSSTPNNSESTPNFGSSKHTQNWDMERSVIKDKRKELFSFLKPETPIQKSTILHLDNNPDRNPNMDDLEILQPLIQKALKQNTPSVDIALTHQNADNMKQ